MNFRMGVEVGTVIGFSFWERQNFRPHSFPLRLEWDHPYPSGELEQCMQSPSVPKVSSMAKCMKDIELSAPKTALYRERTVVGLETLMGFVCW